MIEYFVITSDAYVHLMKDYSYFFNKNWSSEINVIILGYEAPKDILPKNFHFNSLGNQNNFGTYWTNGLIPYFEKVKSDYVCILIDDLFFITPIIVEKIDMVFNEIRSQQKSIDKFLLGSIPNNMIINSIPFTENSLLIHKDISYRTTLKPSIWKTEYFRKMLKPNYNAWDFEIKNMDESKGDGSIIISHKEVNLITEFNVYEKGKFNHRDYENKQHMMTDDEKVIIEKYR